ncbi:MAG: hypothetical protein AABX51_00270 [Nanoarchaeota archaeon]
MPIKIVDNLNLDEVVALHGTSIQAALAFQGGEPMRPKYFGGPVDEYMYFIPVKKQFIGHPLYDILQDATEFDIYHHAMRFAENAAVRDYANFEAAMFIPESLNITDFAFNPQARHAIFNGLESDYCNNLPPDVKQDIDFVVRGFLDAGLPFEKVQRILQQSILMRGVILGLGTNFLELPLEIDYTAEFGGSAFVKVKLSGGLNPSYVQCIKPVGTIESSMYLDAANN